MHGVTVPLLLQCTLCLAIRVPVDWNNDSEVKQQFESTEQKVQEQAPIYHEYFQYTAKKPQFAVDIAAAHGVPSPESNFKSYPIKPYTELKKPVLGQHHIFNSDNKAFEPFQQFAHNSGGYVTPVKTSYEIYHPYVSEQPALQEIYKDPVLDKIRNDLRDSKHRLHKYENEAGESDIRPDEYLETPEETDRKKIPQKNIPVQFELHRPQRRPVYYRLPPRPNYREQILNHKLRHPWNQNIAKVAPIHYRPVKNHLHRLRQQHAMTYGDEQNEYPQVTPPQHYEEEPDGYDIYEKGREKYLNLRNNLDETINKVVLKNKPQTGYNLELQNERIKDHSDETSDEEEFVPIKNYAQVRKTEITKHLPKSAAIRDAENFEEIQNAPRLREAIKSTKAQVVYSEEGYEDAAYDHAGEQKHASDHEGHGGYLKENEISGGKYKIPTVSSSFADADGSAYRDQLLHGEKWNDEKKENEDETETDDYSEDDDAHDLSGDIVVEDFNDANDNDRNKRNSEAINDESVPSINESRKNRNDVEKTIPEEANHDVIKRETKFKIPEFDFKSTLPTEDNILKLSSKQSKPQKIKKAFNTSKYPYYSKYIKTLSKNSPLRYAENIKLMPKKSNGGTEFYDSRSKHQCPDVEDDVDPIPDKLKKDGHPDDDDNSSDDTTTKDKFDSLKNKQRLNGLGDKIDCFKAKYFGENPLDSPFFKEDIIENPEPVTKPNLKIFKTKQSPKSNDDHLPHYNTDIFASSEKNTESEKLHKPNNKTNNDTLFSTQSDVYKNVLSIIHGKNENTKNLNNSVEKFNKSDVNYKSYQNKEDVTKAPLTIRKKRATQFMYEPYKIIRDSQVQGSKKATTTANISPLIKQLQSSSVVDKVISIADKEQALKKNTKTYKDIGKIDRQKPFEAVDGTNSTKFVDVNSGNRRGEPLYELRPANHKSIYSPVTDKRAISVEEYKTKLNSNNTERINKSIHLPTRTQQKRSNSPKTTSRPFFDVSKYLPQVSDTQNIAASNAVKKVIRTSPDTTTSKVQKKPEKTFDQEEEYDEYEDNDEEDEDGDEIEVVTTTTTSRTTTKKPTSRRTRGTTTTIAPNVIENDSEAPKLRLTTRFRSSPSTEKTRAHHEVVEEPLDKVYKHEGNIPKYTEKKRKSTKSTLVTDTKTYGDEDEDDTKKEIDELLQVKQDMDEYMPKYEKMRISNNKDDDRADGYNNVPKDKVNPDPIYEPEVHKSYENDDDDDDDDNDDDDDDNVEDEDDGDDEDDDDEENYDNDNEKKDATINSNKNENSEKANDNGDMNDRPRGNNQQSKKRIHLKVTTSEPTKRTLVRTTIPPPTTTESRSARVELKPTILKKKIEIHEESPVNRKSPHITEFRQNIKEIEIIKEMPPKPKRKKNNHNSEALDLYRDENLAEEINKLGDVEVFKENLDLSAGPKHGGNYRSITPEELQREKETISAKSHDNNNKEDVETSETETKNVELDDHADIKPTTFKSLAIDNTKSAKYTELSDSAKSLPKTMHGGNLKFSRTKGTRHNNKSEKLIELDDEDEDENTSSMHGGNFKSNGYRNSGRNLHGGNYKSEKIIQADVTTERPTRSRSRPRDARTNAAVLLDTYARAVPILTTAPPFILDPSKRMYYYVEV